MTEEIRTIKNNSEAKHLLLGGRRWLVIECPHDLPDLEGVVEADPNDL